jgi:methylmalonyl-CoA mutase N-terminal domain/subunit
MNTEELEKLGKQWEEKTLNKVLSKFPERSPKFTTDSGIELHRVYSPLDTKDLDYGKDLGFPGEYPYTRGIQPTMFRGRLWTMRQYAGFANARESNRRYRFLLDHGQTGLSIAFDLPTQIGYDSDHPLSDGEVGKVGVAIDSLRDIEILFDQIPLEKVTTSMTINATAAILLAMYVALAKKRGTPLDKLGGTIQNDILKEYVARGTHRFPITASMRLVTDIFKYCTKNLPRWNMISISGYHIREAGSTAVQEVAFRRRWIQDSASMLSPIASPSSLTPITISLRRSRSSGPPDGYGLGSQRSDSTRRIRIPTDSDFTRRRRAAH